MQALRLLVAVTVLSACGPHHPDVVEPDVCRGEPEGRLPKLADAELATRLSRARYAVRGRLRFTAATVDWDGQERHDYRYAVVDVLEVLRGDPWIVLPHYRRSFPLLAPADEEGTLAALRCRQDEAFVFLVDLPDQQRATRGPVPDPVARSFGPFQVKLYAALPESARDRITR